MGNLAKSLIGALTHRIFLAYSLCSIGYPRLRTQLGTVVSVGILTPNLEVLKTEL